MLLDPDGKLAGKLDRIMLLAMWARKLQEEIKQSQSEKPPIIIAGLGKPTFPVNEYAAKSAMLYWSNLWSRSQEARHLFNSNNVGFKSDEDIVKLDAVIGYSHLKGDIEARNKMAKALTRWYGEKVNIEAENILFTVGGAGALYVIFQAINKRIPNGTIITPFPHYSLYIGADGKNNLFPIPVMQEKGYQLTADLFASSLKQASALAKKDNREVSAFLLCDPNNPLGTIIEEKELYKIAELLRRYPKMLIVLDEAYAEMRLDGKKHVSLLSIAPDLKQRIVLMRSATKALSSAGERMAVIVTFDNLLMSEFVRENTNVYGHAPRSLQHAFAEAMDKLDAFELANLSKYYRQQTEYVTQRLKGMGATMPDASYHTTGTFYVVGDFSDLLGIDLLPETKRALNKIGKITSDEDIAYYLLFSDGVMLAPLSYFGLSNRQGYLRITCSGGSKELTILMDRLELRLCEARKIKQARLELELSETLKELSKINHLTHAELIAKIDNILEYQSNPQNVTAINLKESNLLLKNILANAKSLIPQRQEEATIKIQSWWRGIMARKETHIMRASADKEWKEFVDKFARNSSDLKKYLLALPYSKRLDFLPWKYHSQEISQLKQPQLQLRAKL